MGKRNGGIDGRRVVAGLRLSLLLGGQIRNRTDRQGRLPLLESDFKDVADQSELTNSGTYGASMFRVSNE
jgi:hypothetical protein